MLTSLTINNVVLIDALNVEFANGLCALTGEDRGREINFARLIGLGFGGTIRFSFGTKRSRTGKGNC